MQSKNNVLTLTTAIAIAFGWAVVGLKLAPNSSAHMSNAESWLWVSIFLITILGVPAVCASMYTENSDIRQGLAHHPFKVYFKYTFYCVASVIGIFLLPLLGALTVLMFLNESRKK